MAKDSMDLLMQAQDALGAADVTNKFLTFFAQDKLYGLTIANVNGITQMQDITEMPELPHYVKGIINLRGVVIPLVDVNLRFGNPEQEYTDRTCIVTLEVGGNRIGFIVDAVDAVVDIPEENISPPPALTGSLSGYVVGVAKTGEGGTKLVLLLDSNAMVGEVSMVAGEINEMVTV